MLHLQVARCTKIINPNTDDAKYVINVKQIAKFVVGLGDKVAPTDIEEGMRVGVDRTKYQVGVVPFFSWEGGVIGVCTPA
jgi:26S proteasome regulatory subunit T1